MGLESDPGKRCCFREQGLLRLVMLLSNENDGIAFTLSFLLVIRSLPSVDQSG